MESAFPFAMRKPVIVASIIILTALVFLWVYQSFQPPHVTGQINLLGDVRTGEGFARADQVRSFDFPEDHGPHPEYQTEWWYYTGNLETSDGRHFGYQLTFFRRAITPTIEPRSSDWATNQIYFAHLALSDVQSNMHSFSERFERGAAGLAGANGHPYRVWLDDWHVESLDTEGGHVRLVARDSNYSLNLVLKSVKAPVLHGDNGLSQKSSGSGNASYYYSLTRLETHGTLGLDGEKLEVNGFSWMDHEFSTTSLGENAVGWDWFSIQLTDRREVMFFQIRQKDGSLEPLSGGTLIEPDGTWKRISLGQIQLRVLQTWRSNPSGAVYPSKWSMEIPAEKLNLDIEPFVADQEMRVSIVYWEGAVKIDGRSNNTNVVGSGYVEMTGYAK